METAINMAYETDEIREVESRGDQVEIARFTRDAVKSQLNKCHEEAKTSFLTVAGPKLTLVIDGKCLMYALDPSLRVILLNLSLNCSSVVCCRISPLQKAQYMEAALGHPKSESVDKVLKYFEEEKNVDGAEDLCKMLKKVNRLDSKAYDSLLRTYIAAGKPAPDMRMRIETDGIEVNSEFENLLEMVCPK